MASPNMMQYSNLTTPNHANGSNISKQVKNTNSKQWRMEKKDGNEVVLLHASNGLDTVGFAVLVCMMTMSEI